MTDTSETITQFEEDVIKGLSGPFKRLPSKYFYDEQGDLLFQQIMGLDEYYLTSKEKEVFTSQKAAILSAFGSDEPFRIIELGAGDGTKTKILLSYFLEQQVEFTYCPIDISGNALEILSRNMRAEMPELRMEPYEGDYFRALEELSKNPEKDVVFFLGSNIGNFGDNEDVQFLQELNSFLKPSDLLFMGMDLKKDPGIILSAYNDAPGTTKAFNLNLLARINKELNGDFNIDEFVHYPYYNPQTGECRSYLISKIRQTVQIGDRHIHFRPWESIFMEISKKYDPDELGHMAESTGFKSRNVFFDHAGWFADVLWEKP